MATTLHCPSRPKDVNELIRRLTSADRNKKEARALQALVCSMVELFQNEKKSTYLIEAAQLAAIVDEARYKILISSFCNAIIEYTSDNNILDPALLQTFAHALRRRGTLSADNANLGAALDSLHIRLDRAAKAAESEKQYQLICTLSIVLDAMVDIHVTGIDREWLHKPLRDQLDRYRKAPEPRLRQAASYAYEALRGVPDNDGPWKAFCRISWKVISVLAAVAGGISEMNPQNIIDAAPDAMELLHAFRTLVRTGKEVIEGTESLKDAFLDTMKGLKKPMLWYGTLRYCRLLIEAGMFGLLKKIIPGLPAFKEAFWAGIYAQLEQTWVASNELKSEIQDFAEWLHGQECLRIATSKYPQISEWKNLLASTLKNHCWEQSMPGKRRHHRYQFWRKEKHKPRLDLFCYLSNTLDTTSCVLLSKAWDQCLEAKQYYADCRLIQYYTEGDHLKIRRISGDGLDLRQCYINLSVLEQSPEIGTHRKGFELSLRARLKVEAPTEGKETELQDLFNDRNRLDGSSGRPRRILIRGRAGVGKTTLCKKIVHEFLHGRLWPEHFDRILWIPLRNLRANPTLEAYLEDHFFATSAEKKLLAQALWKKVFGGSNRTLFLLDGFDEVVGERTAGGDLVDALKDLFDQDNIIMTSRPYAVMSSLPGFDLEVETIGFHPHQVQNYVVRVVKNEVHAKEIRDFIESHAIIGGLLQIPVQLDSLCFTWGEGLLEHDAKTMTALYQAIEVKLWRKDMVQLGKSDKLGPLTDSRARTYRLRSQIETVMEDEVRLVEMLAFTGLYNNIIEFQSQHRDALYQRFPHLNDSMLDGLSFLRSPESSTGTVNQTRYFVHLTFQEYFAAVYFARCWITDVPLDVITFESGDSMLKKLDPHDLIRIEKYSGRYNIMWRFTAGLLYNLREERRLLQFFEALESKPRDMLGPAHLRLLMHCLHEVPTQRVHPDLMLIKSKTETELSRLISYPAFIRYDSRELLLVTDLEIPEYILGKLLGSCSDKTRLYLLRALRKRTRVSRDLLRSIASDITERDIVSDLQKEALYVLACHGDSIPEIIMGLLDHPDRLGNSDSDIIKAIGWPLARCAVPTNIFDKLRLNERSLLRQIAGSCLKKQLPPYKESFDAAKLLLQDPDVQVRDNALLSLRMKRNLPPDIVKVLAGIAENQSEGYGLRRGACTTLGDQNVLSSEILSTLESLVTDDDGGIVEVAVEAYCCHAPLTEYMRSEMQSRITNGNAKSLHRVTNVLCKYSEYADDLLHSLTTDRARPFVEVPEHVVEPLKRFHRLPDHIIQGLINHLGRDSISKHHAAKCIGSQVVLSEHIFQALVALTKDEDALKRRGAIESLMPHLDLSSSHTPHIVLPLLEDPVKEVRSSVMSSLSSRTDVPDTILRALSPYLASKRAFLTVDAAETLYRNPKLPLDILEQLVRHLDNFHGVSAQLLITQEALPPTILESLALILGDGSDPERRSLAWDVLRKREDFFAMLPFLAEESLIVLFRGWLTKAIEEEICCYFRDNVLYIDLPERLWEVPFECTESQTKLWAALEKARVEFYTSLPEIS
ncbi:NACHT domain-containing protein [Aspergillus ibericus CBS 121593]|uniref:NACHT domain-containing protein n=1 Tax=Aspergillus ibericus CBS 121593 TaxID=1448316 RepID=A0A395GLK9_9EURO|nr:hypothetical protein BO80DRAFT_228805 [Aspergillus ibericus CBS 121593]RAK96385.1 hypothetical protein BO80DRAFT_228805 [Aspergillus ibericus CBS 121593]